MSLSWRHLTPKFCLALKKRGPRHSGFCLEYWYIFIVRYCGSALPLKICGHASLPFLPEVILLRDIYTVAMVSMQNEVSPMTLSRCCPVLVPKQSKEIRQLALKLGELKTAALQNGSSGF